MVFPDIAYRTPNSRFLHFFFSPEYLSGRKSPDGFLRKSGPVNHPVVRGNVLSASGGVFKVGYLHFPGQPVATGYHHVGNQGIGWLAGYENHVVSQVR